MRTSFHAKFWAHTVASDDHPTVVSLLDGTRQVDLSAELRRGLARLDVDDPVTLARQPGLARAARDAIADPATRSSPVSASRDYQAAVARLGVR